MKVVKHNLVAACVSVLGALAALILVLKGLDGFQVWAASPRTSISDSVPGSAAPVAVPVQAPAIPTLFFPADGAATSDSAVSFGWGDVGVATYTLQVGAIEHTVSDTSKMLYLGDGAYTWTVQAVDEFGVPSGYAAPWTLEVDTVPPSAPTLISPTDGAASDTADIRFSWSDVAGADFYRLRVDDGAPHTAISTSMLLSNLAEGVHEWAVEAVDKVGHASGYTDPRWVTVDTEPPAATIVAPMQGTVLTTADLYTVTIRGTASDAGAGIDRVEVNAGDGWKMASGTGPWSYTWSLPLLDNELQQLRARAFDRAGNDSLQSQIDVVVDTVAPATNPPLPDPPREWVTQTVVYDWPPSADGSGIDRYQIRVYTSQGYSETFETADPGYVFAEATREGEGYFAQARAVDGRGNWGQWSAPSNAVIPDLTSPTVRDPYILEASTFLHAVDTTLYYLNTMPVPQLFEVRGYADDGPSGVKQVCFTPAFGDQPSCDTDGFLPWQSGDFSYAVDGGTETSGVIVATIHDKAGNTVPQTYTYELDETPPESTASASDYATTSPIRVDWTADDTQSGVLWVELWYRHEVTGTWTYVQRQSPGNDSFEFLPLDGPGMYYFRSIAEDNVGNREGGVTGPDTQTLYDTTKPTSEVTWAPAYWNKPGAPITMTWVATPSLPTNPVTEVRLWYRHNQGEWNATPILGVGNSGVFVFDRSAYPPTGDGVYQFESVAQDASGKSEALPFSIGDRATVYDTEIDAPVGLACVPAGWTHTNSFAVRWTNPDDLSGIAAAYYRVGSAPTTLLDGTRLVGNDLEQVAGIVLPGEGRHKVWVWLEDKASNADHNDALYTTCEYDAHVGAPSGLAVTPSEWTASDVFTVTWSNPGDLSGVAGAYWKLDSSPTNAEDGTRAPGLNLDRIGPISVSDEGAHTLYLWLYDAAGNIGFGEQQTASLQYDPTPPTQMLISTPISMTKASFEVYWTANAAASGLSHYTVEYSRATDTVWQPWLTATTEISDLFTAPLADTDYAFRVTAYDLAGNSAQAQTAVYLPLQRVYMSIFSNRWAEWYLYDTFEPNDSWQDAYGPLKIGQTYRSSVWNREDLNDWYHFTTLTGSRVSVYLDGIPKNKDYDLYVYGVDKRAPLYRSDRFESSDEEIRFWPTPGAKYWILVRPYQGPEPPPPPDNYSQDLYSLTVSILD